MFVAVGIVVAYIVFVWLVFFRFRLLKFNIVWGIVGFWVGVHLLLIFLIALRFFQPYSMDSHVIRPTIQLVPRLPQPTLLEEVLVTANQQVKAGDVMYQFDKTVYEANLETNRAKLVEAQQNAKILEINVDQANDALDEAVANQTYAQEEVKRYSDLVPKGGARQETLDKWTQQLAAADAQVAEAKANVTKAELARDAKIDGVNAQVVAAEADLSKSQYYLDQTTIRAPEDGMIVTQQARPGLVVGNRRIAALAVLVADADPYLLATFYQEHLKFVEPGQEVEVALDIFPGQIFKGEVESVWWGTGQGQIKPSGNVPTFRFPKLQGRIAVQIKVTDPSLKRFPAGAHGAVAIYTGLGKGFEPLRRINIRLYSWANFLFPLSF
ncbi:HlyD family secretion protein [Hoeflea prorocentri]|uniref:Efflux RND transporter periplasmic adaptor subunit n=1 Tax=Hoeflea prorocentri TaxID=1922333 RepID=A0A9X3UMT3_9HYPH|nr:efflux RND transporter periplasmic adaptor subunit [Hoeflea prorocentri]MCY6383514.1 efflux RND transporter periplasmic adaptor subunit [Hoeflea prorocentri]MDA5401314.1 efflux RND transporter periplasmic adaptor subunit [Hoeflea prorocentri]